MSKSQGIQNISEEIKKLPRMRDLDPEKICLEGGYADKVAEELKEKLKPTQLRKVFHRLKEIERRVKKEKTQKFDYTQVVKLFPQLAYAKGRRLIPEEFYQLLKLCLDRQKLETNQDFLRTADFITAILAYHKYYKPL